MIANRLGHADIQTTRRYLAEIHGTVLAFLVLAVAVVPAVLIGKALDFGGVGWFGVLIALMFLASAIDREGFYGPRHHSPPH